ncbi:hypothetical protein B0A49_13153 [Cryomyces minteri]|uniref:Uncharacterized protein n=1 Tax=Cryomyces minteri TaxID=331657 RepID=A0A4V6WKC3_9PEZI|nr:hypothetical protein B0A49_13153 [Cryomyces minteri]
MAPPPAVRFKPPSASRAHPLISPPSKAAEPPSSTAPSSQHAVAIAHFSQRFARPPRFTFATPKSHAAPAPNLPPSTYRPPAKQTEDIEDAGPAPGGDDEDDEMLDLGDEAAFPSIEASARAPDSTLPFSLPLSPKRRRLSPPACPSHSASSAHNAENIPPSPTVPVPPRSTPRRFVFHPSTPLPQTTTTSSSLATPSRPTFLIPAPSTSAAVAASPPPEAFSPRRRRDRFVAGGMAAEVSKWAFEVGQPCRQRYANPTESADENESGTWALRFEVMEVREGTLVKGRRRESDTGPAAEAGSSGVAVSAFLADRGTRPGAGGRGRDDLLAGAVVGVKAPAWTIRLEGAEWAVCVDWRVLSHPGPVSNTPAA